MSAPSIAANKVTTKLSLFVFDEISGKVLDGAHADPETRAMRWGESRIQSPQARGQVGPLVDSISQHPLSPESLSSGGLPGSRLQWLAPGRDGGDQSLYPRFGEGFYQYKGDWHELPSDRTVHEIWNSTSAKQPTDAAYRHTLGRVPDFGAPMEAVIYERRKDRSPRPFVRFRLVSSFSIYPTSVKDPFHTGIGIDRSVLENSVKELMVDRVLTAGTELVVNQSPAISFLPNYVPASADEAVLSAQSCLPSQKPDKYLCRHYPVEVSSFKLYVREEATIAEWTRVGSLGGSVAGDRHFLLHPLTGEVILNSEYGTPATEAWAAYKAVPMVRYKLRSKDGRAYRAKETDLRRALAPGNPSSLYILKDPEVLSDAQVLLESPGLTQQGNSFSGLYYGDPAQAFTVRVINKKTGKPIPSLALTVKLQDPIGSLLGITGTSQVIHTDGDGRATFHYLAPLLGQVGLTSWERNGVDDKKLDLTGALSEHGFLPEPLEIYTYVIRKDDPLVGRLDLPANPAGTLSWDPKLLNGRREVLHYYEASARHPALDTLGAFVPLRPAQVLSDALLFPSTVPLADANDANNWIGGYHVMGPRKVRLQVSAGLPDQSVSPTSPIVLDFDVVVRLSDYAKGDYVTGTKHYPLGWRLPGDMNRASQLGGALYTTINPVAGTHTILFETAQQYKAYHGILDLKVTVTV